MWKTIEPLNFHSDRNGKNYVVPKDTVTDLKSSIRKNASAAAIIHDHLYQRGEHYKQIENRKEADEVFLEAMLDSGVSRSQAYVYYWGVRCFGNRFYKPERS